MRWDDVVFWVITAIAGVMLIGYIGFQVWIWIRFGGVPVAELPAWVVPFIFHGFGKN